SSKQFFIELPPCPSSDHGHPRSLTPPRRNRRMLQRSPAGGSRPAKGGTMSRSAARRSFSAWNSSALGYGLFGLSQSWPTWFVISFTSDNATEPSLLKSHQYACAVSTAGLPGAFGAN